ncbi:MAG TPA: very short patch repair endonuclease, partial [Verrucomicrobiae bacterium]|nr:very short patch repair endonuclease [Verrucomicrobiae bacterium]
MADIFSRGERSKIMSKVKGRGNAATELRLISIFRADRIRGWRRRARIFGSPDFVFPKIRLAVFVDGCFWHGCPLHATLPATNRAFWARKLGGNKRRDKLVRRRLKTSGWRVLR